jgi:hypothetical protein
MWKFGLWPRNSFSGNICFEFSVLVLCSEAFANFAYSERQRRSFLPLHGEEDTKAVFVLNVSLTQAPNLSHVL